MLGVDGVVAAGDVGWVVAGVPDRERAWAAAEARVVTILAAEMRDLGGERDGDRCEEGSVQSTGLGVVFQPCVLRLRRRWEVSRNWMRIRIQKVVMLTILTMVVMVLTDELHGWPELFAGVVGWCSVKSAATPVWCAACSMWGSSGRPLGSVGVPGVAHQFVRDSSARLGWSARRLRHPPEPSAQFCHDNHEGTDGHAGDRVGLLYNPIGPPAHRNGPFQCVFPCRKTLVSSTAHKYENSRKMRCWPFLYCSARTCEVRLNITSSAAWS